MMTLKEYNLNQWFFKWFTEIGLNSNFAEKAAFGVSFLLVLLLFLLTNFVTKKWLVKILHSIVQKTKFTWDNVLYETGLLRQIAYVFPVVITKISVKIFFAGFDTLITISQKIIDIYILILIINIIQKIISLITQRFKKDSYNSVAIEGLSQFIKIILYVLGAILLFSILSDVNLKTIFASLGALAAVLILVFRDTILGFVSSIQIAISKTIKVGDWVTLPQHNVDGTILEISLFFAKIENWDKTISSIPTSAFINYSVKNWEGMTESKVRRIKIHLNIDANSVKFCDAKMLNKFKQYELMKNFITQKEKEIQVYNDKMKIDKKFFINGRNLTNIGLFRNYAELYLKSHSKISQKETLMVRLLQPTTEGIPMEFYCFCEDTRWVNYEKIQSDIMDHLLSSVVDFDLEIFQTNKIISKKF